MWKPKKFKYKYLFATLYVFTLTIPSATAVYWAFGDQLLNHSNAFSLLPKTAFQVVAVTLMLIHQFITFEFACTPLYFVWEKNAARSFFSSYQAGLQCMCSMHSLWYGFWWLDLGLEDMLA
ncbi:hypothetical protein RJT34_25241 [Clitoria ternatea]|uniref:Amino acid transporter transmembrane domain-containing protein n=1 Tax=Clitoria ternatea TaxID=43366 RepID=A0AAN9IIQ2_CLITE